MAPPFSSPLFRFSLLLLLLLGSLSLVSPQNKLVHIDPTTTWGTWEGWGTSLAWWANVFGQRTDLADLLYTTQTVTLAEGGPPLPGLGFNVVRWNLGGSGSNTIHDPEGNDYTMKSSPAMPAFKQIQTYQLDWFNPDPSSSSWNWWTDSNQRNMVWAARDRGANLFEAFVDSPPWWMTYNHATSGSNDGSSDCLQSWNLGAYANYLATIVGYARDNWGVEIDYVEPFNEPSANWWSVSGGQEGCHFDVSTMDAIVPLLRSALDRLGLGSCGVSASDENSIDQALSTWNSLSNWPSVAKVGVHGYSGQSAYRGTNRAPLYQAVVSGRGRKLWMTEYGENDASGLTMAVSIGLDLNELHPTAWVYWQAFDSIGWGMIDASPGEGTVGSANGRYYVMAQFSRHVRPGMTVMSSDDENTVVAYDGTNGVLVIVSVNAGSTGTWVDFDLSRFTQVGVTAIKRWETDTGSSGPGYNMYTDTQLQSGNVFWSWFNPMTVQTFEVYGVVV